MYRGLEKALDQYAQPAPAPTASESAAAGGDDGKAQEAKRSSARESRKKALKNLSVPERDVLLVLGAICKVCYRASCWQGIIIPGAPYGIHLPTCPVLMFLYRHFGSSMDHAWPTSSVW